MDSELDHIVIEINDKLNEVVIYDYKYNYIIILNKRLTAVLGVYKYEKGNYHIYEFKQFEFYKSKDIKSINDYDDIIYIFKKIKDVVFSIKNETIYRYLLKTIIKRLVNKIKKESIEFINYSRNNYFD